MFPREFRNKTKTFFGMVSMTMKGYRRPILPVDLGLVPEGKFVLKQLGSLIPFTWEQNSDTFCYNSRIANLVAKVMQHLRWSLLMLRKKPLEDDDRGCLLRSAKMPGISSLHLS